ncbi:MAG: FG-GAP-like repeat-containing protein [Planctomycetota bacterium]|nr:FG-GAP-like repeat-containing protein [Planctomycetota bacterium]
MSQSSQPPAPRFAPWKGIVLLLLALGAVYFAYRLWPEPSEESRGLKLSAAQYEHLYALRNLALGEIEAALSTGDLKHALELLDEIEQILPGDRFVTQNRAITYIEALQTAGKATTPDVTIDGVFEVIEALKKAEPKSAIPYLLAGQVAEKSGDGERMLPEAQKAVELAPNDPIAWYSLAKTAEFLPDDADVVKGAKVALTKALALDPTNSQLLRLQAKSLAESQDPQAIDVLERLRGQTALLELVRRMPDTKEDPEKMIDDAVAAVKREDWSKAMVSSERLGNIIKRQDWVRSDLRRLEPNPLAHVALDFSTRIASAGHSKSHESQPISFRAMEGLAAFTSATDVKDLKLADANDDGQLDLVLLSANGLRVLARQGAEWKPLLEYVAEGPFNQVLVADLDRDETNTEKKPIPQGEQTPLADPRVCDTADIDFVLAGPGGVVILRNELVTQGTGRHLVAVEQLEAFSAQRDIRTATLVDFDQDGDLDLVLALESGVRFWRNRGDLTMEDVTRRSQALPENVKITSFFPAPWNYDCFIDIVATTAAGRVGFYENLGHSTFRWQEMTGRFAEFSGMSEVAVIDADGNADWDLVGVGKAGVGLALSRAADVGTIAAIDVRSLSSTGGNRFLTVDFNNDSWFDLLTWTKAGDGRPQILLGGPKGVFSTEPSSSVGLPGGPVFALAAGDLDHDGDWDLAVAGPEGVKFFANEGAGKNHWTEVRLRAQPADDVARVNHLGGGGGTCDGRLSPGNSRISDWERLRSPTCCERSGPTAYPNRASIGSNRTSQCVRFRCNRRRARFCSRGTENSLNFCTTFRGALRWDCSSRRGFSHRRDRGNTCTFPVSG